MESHPLWVRGLKLDNPQSIVTGFGSHPLWVRGLKHVTIIQQVRMIESHPLWVRGLKHGYRGLLPRGEPRRTLCGCVD